MADPRVAAHVRRDSGSGTAYDLERSAASHPVHGRGGDGDARHLYRQCLPVVLQRLDRGQFLVEQNIAVFISCHRCRCSL